MSELIGINLAMQTPLFADGSVDYARWEELIDIYVDAGVHGLVLGSGTGQHSVALAEAYPRLDWQPSDAFEAHVDVLPVLTGDIIQPGVQ